MLPPDTMPRSTPRPTQLYPGAAPLPTMHNAPASNALELRRCVVEAANASTALMLANARASAANAQLLSAAMPVSIPDDRLYSRCSSRSSSTTRRSVRNANCTQMRVCYDEWVVVINYWLDQLIMLREESMSSMLMRFMWISRSNVRAAATFGLLNDPYRGRRLHSFLEVIVREVNKQPGMTSRDVQIDCNLQKVHMDAHRRHGGSRVSSHCMPVLSITPSVNADSRSGCVEKTPDNLTLCFVWQNLADVAERIKAEFSAIDTSRRRRQSMFGKPWVYPSSDFAPGCDSASIASESSSFQENMSATSEMSAIRSIPTLDQERMLSGHSSC